MKAMMKRVLKDRHCDKCGVLLNRYNKAFNCICRKCNLNLRKSVLLCRGKTDRRRVLTV